MRTSRIISVFMVLIIVMVTVTCNSRYSKKEENTTTNTVPLITTKDALSITNSTAIVGGVVISNGGFTVSERGVCYNTSSNPTIEDISVQSGSETVVFECEISRLNQNTKYYFKAYAMDGEDIEYGEQKSFTTATTITDPRDGQIYNISTIGTQTWFAQNLNYQTGNSWCYDDNTSNCTTYGRLYDWQTALGSCPSGWHLPSKDEWIVLINFLGGESIAGGKMKEKGIGHWNAPNTGATNSSGFTALPGGYRVDWVDHFSLLSRSYFWSSTASSSSHAWYQILFSENKFVYRYDYPKSNGFSVRCVRD